jgi:hypothetical protein
MRIHCSMRASHTSYDNIDTSSTSPSNHRNCCVLLIPLRAVLLRLRAAESSVSSVSLLLLWCVCVVLSIVVMTKNVAMGVAVVSALFLLCRRSVVLSAVCALFVATLVGSELDVIVVVVIGVLR